MAVRIVINSALRLMAPADRKKGGVGALEITGGSRWVPIKYSLAAAFNLTEGVHVLTFPLAKPSENYSVSELEIETLGVQRA